MRSAPRNVLAAAIVALAVSPAGAITISVTSTTNATTSSTAGPSADRAGAQALAVTDTGGTTPDAVSATVDLATRYASNAAADRPITFSGGTARWTWSTDYTIVFSVTPDSVLNSYEVIVDTRILGELTLLDDLNAAASSARVTDVTGRLNGTVTSALGIAGIAQTFSTGTGVNDAQERNIFGTNSLNLGTFFGAQAFTLRFTFQTEATAPQNIGGADESAARFGANGPLGGATADDYPGPGDVVDRIQGNDGHFVTVTARVLTVPEPGAFALLGMVFAGLGLRGLSRRARR